MTLLQTIIFSIHVTYTYIVHIYLYTCIYLFIEVYIHIYVYLYLHIHPQTNSSRPAFTWDISGCNEKNPHQKASSIQVRFCGETEFAGGIWVGIELDDAVGRRDERNWHRKDGLRFFFVAEEGG